MAEESAVIPACISAHRCLIRASILETQGKCTPLLLSKELLKQLNCVLDLANDRVLLFGSWIPLIEIGKGHYGLRCFDFGSERFSTEGKAESCQKRPKSTTLMSSSTPFGSERTSDNQPIPCSKMAPKINMVSPELRKMMENLQRQDQPRGSVEWCTSD